MKYGYFIKILLAFFLAFAPTQAFAKTIKWSMQGDSLTLDPHAQNEGPTTQVSRQVYEALVTRGLDMKIGPQLATEWRTQGPNTWIFKLREDVKFSDGTPFTSEDVVFSILRAKQRTSDFKEYISTVSGVKAVNDYTVEITTSKPNPILLNQLSNILIMSKKWSEKNFAVMAQNWDAGQETFSAEKVSCPASQFCAITAKFFSLHFFDIMRMFESWFKRIGFGLLVVISTV